MWRKVKDYVGKGVILGRVIWRFRIGLAGCILLFRSIMRIFIRVGINYLCLCLCLCYCWRILMEKSILMGGSCSLRSSFGLAKLRSMREIFGACLANLLVIIFHSVILIVCFNLFLYHLRTSFYHLSQSSVYLRYSKKYCKQAQADHGWLQF